MGDHVRVADELYITEQDPVRRAIEAYLDELWHRAKMERQDRESKWMRNQLTASGDGVDISAGNRNPDGDGGWRAGDGRRAGREKLRVARDKVLTAKAIVGESVYKNNAVPFILKWRAGSAHDLEADGAQDALDQLHAVIDDAMREANVVSTMREAVERGASYGEYWLAGGIDGLTGRMSLESPDVWTMYIDPHHDGDVGNAEYVIRRRALTPYDVTRMVASAGADVYDLEVLAEVKRKASPGEGQKDEDAATVESGKRLSPTVEWTEIWCHMPPEKFIDPVAAVPADNPELAAAPWPLVRAVLAGGRLVAFDGDPGPCPFAHFIWDQDVTQPHPQGVYDAMETSQSILTGLLRAWMRNLQDASQINIAGHRDMLRQDPEELFNGALRFYDVSPEVRDVREAIQQIQVAPCINEIVSSFEPIMGFADMESGVPRVLMGQQPQVAATAYELRSRLNSAGKVLSEVVRRHDEAILFAVRWTLYALYLAGVVPEDVGADVVPQGFMAFSDLVERMDGMQLMLNLAKQFEEVHGRMDTVWIAKQLAQAQGLNIEHVFISDEEFEQRQAQAQEAAQGEQQFAQQVQQARLEEMQAKAERARAQAKGMDVKSQLGLAKFMKSVEDDDFKRGMQGHAPTAAYGDHGIVQREPGEIQLQSQPEMAAPASVPEEEMGAA